MTQFLASVTNIEEAMLALAENADIIDLKNPLLGALGALPLHVVRQVVEAVDGRRLVSATIGDLPMVPQLVSDRVGEMAATGVDIVKIGLFGTEGQISCIRALESQIQGDTRVVAVMLADQSPDFDLIPVLSESGIYGVMLDTAEKNGKGLLDYIDLSQTSRFVQRAKQSGLLTGLAGSLSVSDIASLAPLGADYLGFRGGLCERDDRTSSISLEKFRSVVSVLRKYNTEMPVIA